MLTTLRDGGGSRSFISSPKQIELDNFSRPYLCSLNVCSRGVLVFPFHKEAIGVRILLRTNIGNIRNSKSLLVLLADVIAEVMLV